MTKNYLQVVTLAMAAVVAMIASSIPAAAQAPLDPNAVTANLNVVGGVLTSVPPPLYNIWDRQRTLGASSKYLSAVNGGSNGATLALLLQTPADPHALTADVYLDVDRNPTTGSAPLLTANGVTSQPFAGDIGAEYVVHLASPTSVWVERLRDHTNVGVISSGYDSAASTVRLDIPTAMIESAGNGNVNFGLICFGALGFSPEAVPSPAEYDASIYSFKIHGLWLNSTGFVTITPGTGVLIRRGYLTNQGSPSSPSVADVTVMYQTVDPAVISSVRYALDGQDVTGFIQSLEPVAEIPAFTNDSRNEYQAYEGGAAFHFLYPDVLLPGAHTFSVVLATDQGTFAASTAWFVRTVYGPGDIHN